MVFAYRGQPLMLKSQVTITKKNAFKCLISLKAFIWFGCVDRCRKGNPSKSRCYKKIILLASFLGLLNGCSNQDPSTENRINEEKVSPKAVVEESRADAIRSHMAMRQYYSQLIKNDEVSNPYYGNTLVKRYEKALSLASKDNNRSAMAGLMARLGLALVDYGSIEEGIERLNQSYKLYDSLPLPKNTLGELAYAIGVAHMRLGETENCCANHVAESCIIPFAKSAIHSNRRGSEEAIRFFAQAINTKGVLQKTKYRSMWLINLAYMTLGDYPDKVPVEYRIPEKAFETEVQFKKFKNVAPDLGLATDSLAGGVIVEDMDGDNDMDVIVSSWEKSESLRFYENQGSEGFIEKTKITNLNEIPGGLNLTPADYDNDGDIDIYVSRGAWLWDQGKIPDSLLQRQDDGTYLDVTYMAGMGRENYPSQAAAWADYDNDGDLDLFVGNEHSLSNGAIAERNGQVAGIVAPSQLFQNQGDGTFIDVAELAGVKNYRFCKGCSWGDLNDDRWPDLVVSNLSGENRLYINNSDGTFKDMAQEAGITEPFNSFPVWVWDFNNDGLQDIFIAGYTGSTSSYMRYALGERIENAPQTFGHYIAQGDLKFKNLAKVQGLDGPVLTMGANFGDLNNDGFLDFYLGTGQPDIAELVPNQMFFNERGLAVHDVTMAIGMGHLQKGHAISFVDIDNDGDQDIFQQMGGAKRVDKYRDSLYANPGHNNHWIKIRLEGVISNRSAIGAKIKVTIGGGERSIYRSINTGGSFGANPLQEHIGLGAFKKIDKIEIFWPTSNTSQVFSNISADQSIVIKEGDESFKKVNNISFLIDGYSTQ